MSIFAAFGAGIIFVFVSMVIIGGFFMWIAAKIAGVEKSSFARAIVAAIGSSIASIVAAFIFNLLPVFGNLFGFILGLIVSIFIIKAAFDTNFGKALLVWIFDLIGAVLAIVFAAMITASTLLFR